MKNPVFTGSSVAIVTPFKNGNIDFDTLGRLIDFQIENGTLAITICGTTGEASTMSDAERHEAVDYCVKKVAGRVKVIAGTGSNDTAHALHMSQSAEKSGADALLIVTPYYNKTTQKGLVKHYNYIADRVNIPIIVYNVPSRTGLSFNAQTYYEISKHPNINGVKEASGNFTMITETRCLCGDELNIWSGNDDQVVPIMALGGKGIISVIANIIPAELAELSRLCLAGKFEEASKIQIKFIDLINAAFIEVNPIPIKTAMNLMGMDVGELRLPLCEMSDKNLEILKTAMKKAGIKI